MTIAKNLSGHMLKGKFRMWLGKFVVDLAFKHLPDRLFASLYNLLCARGRLRISREGKDWRVTCFGLNSGEWKFPRLSFITPTPKCLAGGWDEFESKFERFFKIEPTFACLDVGACMGDSTVPMAWKARSVVAMEPEPRNAKYLRLNLANFNNCAVLEKAAWKEKGQVVFHCYYLPTGHSIEPAKGKERVIIVEADTLDNLFLGRHFDFVKIDVQAVEVDVLEAGRKFLSTVPRLIVETHYRTIPEKRTYPRVIEILKELGFHTEFAWDNGIIYAWREQC